jgi:anti-sigma-K factor RskA
LELKEFISSGIIESYISGTASAEEIALVQKMEKAHPEVKAEIDAVEAALLSYAEADVNPAPEALKFKIESKMFDKKEPHSSKSNIVKIGGLSRSEKLLRYTIAASVGLLLGLAAIVFSLNDKLEKTQTELSQLKSENDILANELGKQQQELKAKGNSLTVMMKPGSKMVMLKGMELSPESSAVVVYNSESKAVFLDAVQLPVPPMGKQYQLWAMVDGKPVDAGVFNVTDQGFSIQKMRDMSDADAFAVTLEDAGGRPEPTMSAMYLMGSVQPS